MSTDARIGRTIGGYRIEALLGRGGMGMVYRAEHVALRREVAVKFLPPELAGDEAFRERFLREARLAASIDHPNVLPVYDAEDVDGELLLITRLVEGSDLGDLLRGGRLAPRRALDLLAPVASALDEAHRRGLVHRDVKPGNILIEPGDGEGHGERVYLGDFGLTKHFDQEASSPSLTATGTFVGTPSYAAPEQIEGRDVDGRTDQYALACVLYQAVVGEVPYPRHSDTAAIVAHVTEEVPHLPTDLGIPEFERAGLDAAITRGMAKKREDRFASCTALIREAREALPDPQVNDGPGRTLSATPPASVQKSPEASGEARDGVAAEPAGAAPPPSQESPSDDRAPEPPRRRRTAALVIGGIAAALAVVALVVALALGGSGGGTPASSPAASTSEPGAVVAPIPPNAFVVARRVGASTDIVVEGIDGSTVGDLTPGSADDGEPAISPHRDEIAFVRKVAGNDDIWLMNADGTDAHALTNDPADDRSPGWSGNTIVFESSRSGTPEVYTMDRDGTNVQPVASEPQGDTSPAMSPDGSHIAFVSTDSRGRSDIYVMAADGSDRRLLVAPPGGADDPAWSSDGTEIAFAAMPTPGARSQVWVVLSDGPSTPTKPGVVSGADATAPSWAPTGQRLVFTASLDAGRAQTYLINVGTHGGPVGSGNDERDPSWGT